MFQRQIVKAQKGRTVRFKVGAVSIKGKVKKLEVNSEKGSQRQRLRYQARSRMIKRRKIK